MYTGVYKQGFIQPQTLAQQDIVITTYETLRKEIDYVDLPHNNSKRSIDSSPCYKNRVPTSSGNHGKPGKSLKKVSCMEKSWNLKKI